MFDDKGRELFAKLVPWATAEKCDAYLNGAEFALQGYLLIHFMGGDAKRSLPRMFKEFDRTEKAIDRLAKSIARVQGRKEAAGPSVSTPEGEVWLQTIILREKLRQARLRKPGRGRPSTWNKKYLVQRLKYAYDTTFNPKSRKLNVVIEATRQAYECSRGQCLRELPSLPDLRSDLLKAAPPKIRRQKIRKK